MRSGRQNRSTAADFVVSRGAVFALGIFAAVGFAVLDDYGVSGDEYFQRAIGHAWVNYVLGVWDEIPWKDQNRLYGAAFEVPLVLVERILGLTDNRDVYLGRHLASHLFFLAGGFFCYLLAYRLSGNRLLAIFAMLLFLLHPRLYAHSFFNSKDVPFLSMFMISLYLVHRAFERNTIAAFALCGLGVGLLTNLRIMGVMLLAAVVAMRACDLLHAARAEERKRILTTGGVFLLAGVLTWFISFPSLWRTPFEFVEMFALAFQYPAQVVSLFQGEPVRWPEIPARYVPVWIAITTPPVALLPILLGTVFVLLRGASRPADVLRNTTVRFGFLLIACLTLPVLAVAVFDANIYDGWRHMYFLHAPACLLAVFGLRWAVSVFGRMKGGLSMFWTLAAAGVSAVVVEMMLIHPHQMVYFNFLVNRGAPEHLRARYDMDYYGTSFREGLEHLLERSGSSSIRLEPDRTHGGVGPDTHYAVINRDILPQADRQRIVMDLEAEGVGDFHISNHRFDLRHGRNEPPFPPIVYARKIYGNTLLTVTAVDPSLVDRTTADFYRGMYRSVASEDAVVESDFDLHFDDGTLTLLKEPCRPEDVRQPFRLRVFPVDTGDLVWFLRERGFDEMNFSFALHGVRFEGKCMIRRTLPDYPTWIVEIGQYVPGGPAIWKAAVEPSSNRAAPDVYRLMYRRTVSREPVIKADFSVHLDRNRLIWRREPCSPEDTRGYIFLHVVPKDVNDLPEDRRRHGFDNLDFHFHTRGAIFDGKCLAAVSLPDYAIAAFRTGQSVGDGPIWEGEYAWPE